MDHIFSSENMAYIGSRIRTRLSIFFVAGLILLALISYDVYQGTISWWVGLLSLVVGLAIGYVYGRLARVRWHETEEKIIMQYDVIAYIIIGAYILLSYLRDILLGDLLSGAALEAVSFAVVAGVLIGRIFGLNIAIMRVLRERKAKPLM